MQVLRMKQVCYLVCLAPQTIARWEKLGKFPKRFKLTKRISGWLATDIERWLLDYKNATLGRL